MGKHPEPLHEHHEANPSEKPERSTQAPADEPRTPETLPLFPTDVVPEAPAQAPESTPMAAAIAPTPTTPAHESANLLAEDTQASLPIALDPPVPQPLQDHAFEALFGQGSLDRDAAIRAIATHYRDLGVIAPFKKLRRQSAQYRHIATVMRALIDAGRADRPEPDQVRAIRARPQDYGARDWQCALDAVLTSDLILRDQAIRDAADWARDNLGLDFQRLTTRSRIYKGLDATIEHGVRAGAIKVVAEEYIRKLR